MTDLRLTDKNDRLIDRLANLLYWLTRLAILLTMWLTIGLTY